MSAMPIAPVTLEGPLVTLCPLARAHIPGLCAVGLVPELWKWVPTQVRSADDMVAYVETALAEQARGQSLPFAILDRMTGTIIGSTRYGNIEPNHRRLEIGWTWVMPQYQRTGANRDAKRLLLTHAFEHLGMHRVELKTDRLNEKSRAAIARLGAVEEGIFRKHVITDTGRIRDTVYFSIIDSEWPAIKANLAATLPPLAPP